MYFLIGISLLFAYLYAVNLGASLLSAAVWKVMAKYTLGMRRRSRADPLFVLRALPLAAALVLSLALLVPSFLLFEPHESDETVSYKLAFVVGISLLGIGAAAARIFASWWRTRRLTAAWLNEAEEFELQASSLPAFRIEHSFPVLAVIGVLRPRIFVATQVLEALSTAELNAALAHEIGHITSRDNVKRVAMRICRDMLVFPIGESLDKAWLEAAESAADEFAAGSDHNALDLASALVKIGRIAPAGSAWELPAGAYLTEPNDTSLAARVEDLIDLAGKDSVHGRSGGVQIYALPIVLLTLLVLPAFNENALYSVHRLTELVLANLQ